MKKHVELSEELVKQLVRRNAALAIKKTVVTTMAAAGRATATENDRAFINSVATLNSDYRMLIHKANKEASKAGWDPVNHGALQIYAERGVAIWEEPENAPEEDPEEVPSESEGDNHAEQQEGQA